MGDLENAGDVAGDVGLGAAEYVLDEMSGGLVSMGVEAVKSEFGVDLREEAKDGLKSLGEAGGGAAFDATSEATHKAALEHYDNAGEAYDKGEYGTAVVEGAESVGTIVGGLAESAWDAITD